MIEKELGTRLSKEDTAVCAHDKDFALLMSGSLASLALKALVGGMVEAAAELAAWAEGLPIEELFTCTRDSTYMGRAHTVRLFILHREDFSFHRTPLSARATFGCLPQLGGGARFMWSWYGPHSQSHWGVGCKALLGGAERVVIERELSVRLMDDDTTAGVSDEDFALLGTCETLASGTLRLLIALVVRARREVARVIARRQYTSCPAPFPRQPPRIPTALPTDTIPSNVLSQCARWSRASRPQTRVN